MCKEFCTPYTILKKMPWQLLVRMLADLPRVEYTDEDSAEKPKKLTAQNADEFKAYINQLNASKRKN